MTGMLILAIGFLAPGLFAGGAALVSVPIIIHILNRRRYKVVQWAAMNYLLAAMKKNRRRLKFESLLLLLARCALLLLLGMALSRPFGCQNSPLAAFAGRRAGLHVFVIDNGYAMSYQADRQGAKTNLDQAKTLAKQMIRRLWAGSEAVEIITTAHQPSTRDSDSTALPPTPLYDLEAARAMVDRIEQTYTATDMPEALDRARLAAAAANGLPTKSLYILDDSTRHVWAGGGGDSLQQTGKLLAAGYNGGIVHFNVGLANEFNPAVMDLVPAQRLATLVGEFAPSFVARLRAYGQGGDSQITWRIDDAKQESASPSAIKLDLSDHSETLGRAIFPGGGPHVVSATLISEDKLTCDDTRWRVVNIATDLKMLIVEGERQAGNAGGMSAGGSGAFLKAALDPDPDPSDTLAKKNRLVNVETISDLELSTHPLADYRCIALCGASQISDAVAARLEDFVKNGGALWVFVGPQTTSENYNATLLKHHLLPGPLTQRIIVPATSNAVSDGLLFDFDPSRQLHPLLEPFYQSQGSGLENARVYSYWQVEIPQNSTVERVLDYQALPGQTRKDAAYTIQTLGSGRVIFCSTTADANDEWTAFPAKKAFPEVMLCLFLGSVSTEDNWMNLNVGDTLTPPTTLKMTTAPHLHDSAGMDIALVASESDDGIAYHSPPLNKPGVYTMTVGPESIPIAVNVPTSQADTRAMDSQSIKQALGGIDIDFQQDILPPEAAASATDQGKDFGWSIMLIVLALVALESYMAMKFGRFKRKIA